MLQDEEAVDLCNNSMERSRTVLFLIGNAGLFGDSDSCVKVVEQAGHHIATCYAKNIEKEPKK
jgi:hypothetical protein